MKLKSNNFTLLEIVVATVIAGIFILSVLSFMSAQTEYIKINRDKKYSLLKANQILNELRTYIEDSGETTGNADTLDRLHNLIPHPLLTIMPLPNGEEDQYNIVLSNNIRHSDIDHVSSWRYLRTIQIAPIGVGGTRQITVKIYRGKDFLKFPASNLVDSIDINGIMYYPKPIISLITVLPTIGDLDFESQQVFDFYNIAIENIPGWWVHMGELFPVAQSALDYVDSVNDGMTIRNHWVTKLGYGRDRFYAPYLNVTQDSYQDVENAFYYPGTLPTGFDKPEYYVPTLMKCRMQSDVKLNEGEPITYINNYNPYFNSEIIGLNPAVVPSSWQPYNPHPYAPADYLNNPMRYPDMKKIYDIRNFEAKRGWYHKYIDRDPEKNPGLGEISREDNPDYANVENYFTRVGQGEEMPWSLLLDEMSMNPEKFRNAIFLNLHGELLPMVPSRNYSDAAFSSSGVNIKRPYVLGDASYDAGRYSYFRAVSHAEKIRYQKFNDSASAGAADITVNTDSQNPYFRVYGYLSDPQNGSAWRHEGVNSADGNSGPKKARLDDDEESPITMMIRYHKSTVTPGGDNSDFIAWREMVQKIADMMRSDRYVTFFDGGVDDLNNKFVFYGTHYKGVDMAGSTISVPTEANEGFSYLNHSSDASDADANSFLNSDGLQSKGLGVEPVGLSYSPYFYLDDSLAPAKDIYDNIFYFHQKERSKIHYDNAKEMNVDFVIDPLVPNDILKAAGNYGSSVNFETDLDASGSDVERQLNPAGWTPYFLGVTSDSALPTTSPKKGDSGWFANNSGPSTIVSASANGMGYMRFWDGSSYDDSTEPYHSFPERSDLRSMNFYSTDSLLNEGVNPWNFSLVGPDATNGKYEMFYLSDQNWVPFLDKLNLANQKCAWDDSMSWSLSGTIYIDVAANKTIPVMDANFTSVKDTGKYLISNDTDTETNGSYIMVTTIIPGESSGEAFVPFEGMIVDNTKKISAVTAEHVVGDAIVQTAFTTASDTWTNCRFFKIQTSIALGNNGSNLTATIRLPKSDIGSNIVDSGGGVYDVETWSFKPVIGMKVYNASGGEETRIKSIASFAESKIVGDDLSPAVTKIQVETPFTGDTSKLHFIAVPAIQSTAIGNEVEPLVQVFPLKRGLVLYAETIAQLKGYSANINAGDPSYVRYGVVRTNGADSSDLTDNVYRISIKSGTASWVQVGSAHGKKLEYDANDLHWNKMPYYDRMWAEVEYVFAHSPNQSKWAQDEVIASDKSFTGEHCVLITLHNTPMVTPEQTIIAGSSILDSLATKNGNAGGLPRLIDASNFTNDRRLYKLDYIPAAIRDDHKPTGGDTSTATTTYDLLVNDNKPKNTARWRIKIPSGSQMLGTRDAAVTSSKNISLSTTTVNYFSTYSGNKQLASSILPLSTETRIGAIASAKWNNIESETLNVCVGTNTDYTGADAPAAPVIADGYFLDVSKDVADWSMWGRVSANDDLVYEDCRTHNNSRSFTWLVEKISNYPKISDDVNIPFSEKFQTFGDPRHMPYMDLKDNYLNSNKGYNWYFCKTGSSDNWADYTGFGELNSGYGAGNYEADIPKLFMWLREGLLNSNSLWCSITGYSYYYVGLGNEIGYDGSNGFSNSIPVHQKPWGINSNDYEQSITSSIIGIKNKSGTWEARHFMGELFPEWEYDNFTQSFAGGQLQTGYTSDDDVYYRFNKEDTMYKEFSGNQSLRRTQETGCTALLNVEDPGGLKFNHNFSSGYGNMSQEKIDAFSNAFNIQPDASVSSNRPWDLVEGGNTPDQWSEYSAWRKEGLVIDSVSSSANSLMDMILYNHDSGTIASGLLEVHDKNSTTARGDRKRALFLINGLSEMDTSGPNSISTFSVMSLLYGFMRGGSKWLNPNIDSGGGLITANIEPNFIRQLPKINIISPKITFPINDPICQIKWTVQWKRWDDQPYWGSSDPADPNYWKNEYSDSKPTGSIFFRVIFSEAPHTSTNDWRYVQDSTIKTSAGLTFDKLITDNETYAGSILDTLEIDGDELFVDGVSPGHTVPASGTDVSPWEYRLDWSISGLLLKTAYAFRIECHRREQTMYYIDPNDGVEKVYENNVNAVNQAKNERKYVYSHYTFQQGLMIVEDN
ncbi:MAG: hypothetical protein COA79_03900 [Planctomycetota bacterium]|nr:MAG: hypothetical protein COA79_03900 [Planctomycetota bacterium]